MNARAFVERVTEQGTELLIQTRTKKNEESLELPGGRLELYESILDGLKREVYEETGLIVTEIEGSETRVDTRGINPDFEVECLAPYCVYQTIKGPIDSVGMYFIVKAEGTLLETGDDTVDIRWASVQEIQRLLTEDAKQFSDVDRAGIMYYVKHRKF